jgi:hypothetical protein
MGCWHGMERGVGPGPRPTHASAPAKQPHLQNTRNDTLGGEALTQVLHQCVHDGVKALHARFVHGPDGLHVVRSTCLRGAIVADVEATRLLQGAPCGEEGAFSQARLKEQKAQCRTPRARQIDKFQPSQTHRLECPSLAVKPHTLPCVHRPREKKVVEHVNVQLRLVAGVQRLDEAVYNGHHGSDSGLKELCL